MTHYTKEDRRCYLILQCRYYKGEADAPKSLPEGTTLFWNYERCWVDWSLKGDHTMKELEEDAKIFHLTSEAGDMTPLSLKSLLFNRFMHWTGGYQPIEKDIISFENWYRTSYRQWKTNREHRADKRRPGLTAKCRYYKGETSNPWEHVSFSSINNYRRTYWYLEKNWVEGMSMSYHAFDHELQTQLYKNLEDYIVKQSTPRTLIALILGWHNHVEEESSMMELERDAAIKCYEDMYLRFTPLTDDLARYFGFYLGEKENPYPPYYETEDSNYYSLFWMWEEMIFESLKRKNYLKPIRDSIDEYSQMSECPIMKDEKVPKEIKVLDAYMGLMAGKWLPYEDFDKLHKSYIAGLNINTLWKK